MTRSELTFALVVESILNHIPLPEYRQMVVEVSISILIQLKNLDNNSVTIFLQLLTIVSTILLRNPELKFQKQLDLNKLVEDAFVMYCKDHNIERTDDMTPLFSAPCSITTGYLARAVVNNVLIGGCFSTQLDINDSVQSDEMCKIA